jgi:GMP synthase (glutamine-hydrolysing)
MKTITALRHVHFEDLGTLEPMFQARGCELRYVDAAVDPLHTLDAAAPDLLVVLGGPVGAFDDAAYPFLRDELALVQRRLASGRPMLGICLGAQLIARALGAGVRAMGTKEIGFGPLRLTDAGRASPLAALADVPVLHWHGDQFETPPGTRHLAGTAACANQAFVSADGTVLGLQFHLEADLHRIEPWLVGHAAELHAAGVDPRAQRAQARQHAPKLAAAAGHVVDAWLDGLALPG